MTQTTPIKRYLAQDIAWGFGTPQGIKSSPDGDYVRYSDYASAQQALEHLKAIASSPIGSPEHFRAVEDARLFLNGEEE